jgi:hypothetical protein
MPKALVDCSGQMKPGSVVLVQTCTLKADAVANRITKDTAKAEQQCTFPAIAGASSRAEADVLNKNSLQYPT